MLSIGQAYGLPWRYIWDISENAGLRATRLPEVLFPGDVVQVPEKELREEQRSTGASHRFKMTGGQSQLKVVFLFDTQPRANLPAEVQVGGRIARLQTDGNGLLDCLIPAEATEARVILTVDGHFETYDFLLGGIDPVSVISGIQQRLQNLGYPAGPIDGIDGPLTQAAVRMFQNAQKIAVDGIAGPITQGKLYEVHGS